MYTRIQSYSMEFIVAVGDEVNVHGEERNGACW